MEPLTPAEAQQIERDKGESGEDAGSSSGAAPPAPAVAAEVAHALPAWDYSAPRASHPAKAAVMHQVAGAAEALTQMSVQVLADGRDLVRCVPLVPHSERTNLPAESLVPPADYADRVRRTVEVHMDLGQRAEHEVKYSESFNWSCARLLGATVSKDDVEAMPAEARAQIVNGSRGEDAVDWYYRPMPASTYESIMCGMREGHDTEIALERLEGYVAEARSQNDRIWTELRRSGLFQLGPPSPPPGAVGLPAFQQFPTTSSDSTTSPMPVVRSAEDVRARLRAMVNGQPPHTGAATPSLDSINELRRIMLDRYWANRKAREIARALTKTAHECSTKRRAGGRCMLLATHATIDQFKPLLDELSAPDAAAFGRVLLGARVPDSDGDIFKYVRTRYPMLHIYVADGHFPHHIDPSGVGHVYKEKQLGICIGYVVNHHRDVLRRKARADQAAKDDDISNALVLPPERERARQRALAGDDAGREAGEDLIRVHDADLHHPSLQRLRRRVTRNGWKLVNVKTQESFQRVTVPVEEAFYASPRLTITLVHADTGKPVVPGHPHGGLEPDRWLVPVKGETVLCDEPDDYGRHAFPRDGEGSMVQLVGNGQSFTNSHSNIGTYAKFWPACLTSEHEGRRFKVIATGTVATLDKYGNKGKDLELRAESAPVVFYSNKRAKSTIVGRKRKEKGGA